MNIRSRQDKFSITPTTLQIASNKSQFFHIFSDILYKKLRENKMTVSMAIR